MIIAERSRYFQGWQKKGEKTAAQRWVQSSAKGHWLTSANTFEGAPWCYAMKIQILACTAHYCWGGALWLEWHGQKEYVPSLSFSLLVLLLTEPNREPDGKGEMWFAESQSQHHTREFKGWTWRWEIIVTNTVHPFAYPASIHILLHMSECYLMIITTVSCFYCTRCNYVCTKTHLALKKRRQKSQVIISIFEWQSQYPLLGDVDNHLKFGHSPIWIFYKLKTKL